MWKHYLSSKVPFGKGGQKASKFSPSNNNKVVHPAKYLEPPGEHMEEAIRKIDISRSVVMHNVAIPFGEYEKCICYIVEPARPYIIDRSIRRLPKGRPLLQVEIEEAADRIRRGIDTSKTQIKERAPLFKEAAEGVRAAAAQDKLYGIFQREEGAKRWLYDMSELVQEKDVLLLCALQRASTRPYVQSMTYQRSRWRTFSTIMWEVSNAAGCCMACNYYFGIGRRLRTLGEELPIAQATHSHTDDRRETNNEELTTAAKVQGKTIKKKVTWERLPADETEQMKLQRKALSKNKTATKPITVAEM